MDARSTPSSGHLSSGQLLLALAAVVAVTALVFEPVRRNGFINRDDPDYVTGNTLIRDFSAEGTAKIFCTGQFMGNYHPLTLILLAAEFRLFGLAEGAYHAVSLLLHLVATLLVVLLARRLSGSDLAALGTGLLFGMHPLHVESVAWVSEQKDLLYAVWYLGGLLAYLRYLHGGRTPAAYAATLVLFILSLLSKAMAASFPLVLWLIDALYHRAFDRRALAEKIPFLVLALAFGLVAIHAQAASGAIVDAHRAPVGLRFVVAAVALFRYLLKLALPAGLSAFYPWPEFATAGIWLELAGSLLLLGAAGFAARKFSGRQPLVWFGLAFFLVTVALVLQILPVGGAMMADRYMYLPSFGFLLAAVVLAEHLLAPRRTALLGALIVAAAVALGAAAHQRLEVWRTSVTLWTDVIGRYPGLAAPYLYRANARPLPEEREAAFADFARAFGIDSTVGFGYYSRGYALAALGEPGRAVADYTTALVLGYDSAQTLNARGSALASAGRYDEAVTDLTRAITLNPAAPEPYFNRGNLLALRQAYGRAVADFDTVLRLVPGDAEALANRGMARLRAGDRQGGCEDLGRAARAGVTRAAQAAAAYCR